VSLVTFQRLSGWFPPERELLTVEDDGTFTMWRSFGPSVVGRFGGTVPDADALAGLVAATAGVEPPSPGEVEPDASVEVTTTAGATFEAEAGGRLAGPWGELIGRCRELLDALLDQPVAAVRGTLREDGTFHLSHEGADELPIELGALDVRVVRWDDGVEQATAQSRPTDLSHVDAGPGWELDIPFDPSVFGTGKVVGTATFVASDRGVFAPVVVTAHAAA
jgi:hypothetical protein